MKLIGPLIATVICAGSLSAQKNLCWTPHVLERCKGFVVFEEAYEVPITTTGWVRTTYPTQGRDSPDRVSLTAGVMSNSTAGAATGFTLAVASGAHDPALYWRGEIRHRRWIADRLGVDLSAGFAKTSIVNIARTAEQTSGITFGAGIEQAWFGLNARADLQRGAKRNVGALYFGGKVGGKPAPFVLASTLLGVFIALGMGYGEGT